MLHTPKDRHCSWVGLGWREAALLGGQRAATPRARSPHEIACQQPCKEHAHPQTRAAAGRDRFRVAHRVGVSSPPVSLSCSTFTAKLSAGSSAAAGPPAAAMSAGAGGAGAVGGSAAALASPSKRGLRASRLTLRAACAQRLLPPVPCLLCRAPETLRWPSLRLQASTQNGWHMTAAHALAPPTRLQGAAPAQIQGDASVVRRAACVARLPRHAAAGHGHSTCAAARTGAACHRRQPRCRAPRPRRSRPRGPQPQRPRCPRQLCRRRFGRRLQAELARARRRRRCRPCRPAGR